MNNAPFNEAIYELLKEMIRRHGIHFSENIDKELKPLAEKTLMEVELFKEVLKKISKELIEEQFGK
jgi:hypothetical protein